MRIIRTVTGDTGHCRITMRTVTGVAVAAGGRGMSTKQSEVRQRMIEGGLVECNDVDITTFMLCVAGRTLESVIGRKPSVKTGMQTDVGPDIFMAGNAKVTLRLLGQRCVTGTTIRLDACMTCDNRTRHDQPLLDLGRTRRTCVQ